MFRPPALFYELFLDFRKVYFYIYIESSLTVFLSSVIEFVFCFLFYTLSAIQRNPLTIRWEGFLFLNKKNVLL